MNTPCCLSCKSAEAPKRQKTDEPEGIIVGTGFFENIITSTNEIFDLRNYNRYRLANPLPIDASVFVVGASATTLNVMIAPVVQNALMSESLPYSKEIVSALTLNNTMPSRAILRALIIGQDDFARTRRYRFLEFLPDKMDHLDVNFSCVLLCLVKYTLYVDGARACVAVYEKLSQIVHRFSLATIRACIVELKNYNVAICDCQVAFTSMVRYYFSNVYGNQHPSKWKTEDQDLLKMVMGLSDTCKKYITMDEPVNLYVNYPDFTKKYPNIEEVLIVRRMLSSAQNPQKAKELIEEFKKNNVAVAYLNDHHKE